MPTQSEQFPPVRLTGVFPVYVRGKTATGQDFALRTIADSIGYDGVELQLPRELPPGTRIFTLTRLPGGAVLAARGRVLSLEEKSHGLASMAVYFTRIRLLPSSPMLDIHLPSLHFVHAAAAG